MKLRNFLIVLFAVLIVFAFASCKNEPNADDNPGPAADPEQVIEDPSVLDLYPWKNYTPTDSDVYVVTITDGVGNENKVYSYDKLKFVFGETVNVGDVLTLKYRSERNVYQWDIRDGSLKWVYEKNKNGFEDPVLGEGGWYTLTYTFGENDINGAAITYPYTTGFGVFFRANYITDDVFEIRDITLTHTDETVTNLVIEDDTITSAAELTDTVKDHVWDLPRTYAIFLATDVMGDVDETPIAMKVNAGEKIDYSAPEMDGVTELFFDKERTQPYYKSWKVIEDGLVLYYAGE